MDLVTTKLPHVLVGIAVVLSSWAVCAATLGGIGYLVSRGLGRWFEFRRPTDLLWLGLAVLFTALQLWHFFLPIDWRASLAFVAVGGIGTVLALVRRPWLARLEWASAVAVLLIGLPLCVLIANSALAAPANFDSGMYHFQAIRWSNEYPIVPGLGNLNIQLALNQSFFLFLAWLNVFPFFNQGFHIANSFLLTAALLPIVWLGVQLLWRPRRPTPAELLALLMFPVLLRQVGSFDLHSPAPDIAVLVLSFVLFQRFVALLSGENPDRRHVNGALLMIAALSGLLITIKLSGAALAVTTLAIAWQISRHRRSAVEPKGSARGLRWAAACCLLLPVLLWTGRGLVHSGHPVFPLTVGAVPVEWQVPVEATEYTAFYIRAHARSANTPQVWREALERGWVAAIEKHGGSVAEEVTFLEEAMGGGDWLRPWGERVWRDKAVRRPVWFLLSGALFVLLSLLRRAATSRQGLGKPLLRDLILLSPLVAALFFWFWSAPDPRFGIPLVWLAALWLWAMALSRIQNLIDPAMAATLVNGVIAAACVVSFALDPVVWLASVEANGFRPVPEAAIKRVVSSSGVEVIVCGTDRQCWDNELPASPYLNPALEFLDPEQGLGGGFKVSR